MDTSSNSNEQGLLGGSAQIALRAISDLRPHPRNARKHSQAQIRALAKSIDAFGFNAPVLADKHGNILAGHGRVEAARLLGLPSIPVIFLHHLSEEEARAYMLADNKLTDRSNWDDTALAVELKELSSLALSFDIDATGFELPEIDFRIQSTEEAETIDRADEFEFTSGPAAATPGDIWHLGDHRIICGSALDEKVVSQIFAGDKANATFTDPPYNVKIQGNAAGHGNQTYREFAMATGEMSEPEFTDFLAMALTNVRSHSVPGALIYGCMDWRHIQEMLHAAHIADLHLVNLCVWVKPNGRLGSFYKSRHELVFVFKNGKEAHQNNIQLGRFGRNRTNVWNYSSPSPLRRRGALTETEAHPTVKPLLLVSDAILDCTRRNEIVFDPFLGSGTTLLAAERTGRRCFGIELDPLYVDTAVTRWQRMTGRKAHNHLGESFDILKSQRSVIDGPKTR